jgi:NAD(P)H-hydrate repair Nnr-like enzyme with NAD(P)H-hydrate epimerase domain
MQRAGLAVAKLARALAPHGRRVWIACGPGNNGGDGFEAATHLHRLGWQVHLTWTGAEHSPPDAQWARQRALAAGVVLQTDPPAEFDVCIDALLGLGADLWRFAHDMPLLYGMASLLIAALAGWLGSVLFRRG